MSLINNPLTMLFSMLSVKILSRKVTQRGVILLGLVILGRKLKLYSLEICRSANLTMTAGLSLVTG